MQTPDSAFKVPPGMALTYCLTASPPCSKFLCSSTPATCPSRVLFLHLKNFDPSQKSCLLQDPFLGWPSLVPPGRCRLSFLGSSIPGLPTPESTNPLTSGNLCARALFWIYICSFHQILKGVQDQNRCMVRNTSCEVKKSWVHNLAPMDQLCGSEQVT